MGRSKEDDAIRAVTTRGVTGPTTAARRKDAVIHGDEDPSSQIGSLTQSELARALGINRSAVSQWERERGSTSPNVAHLAAIALATKVSSEWLALGQGDAKVR